MTAELVFQQALNGLSFGALLFILASGLSLVFGMMDVVNLAHGAFYMLGAYVALSVVQLTGSFWLAMLAAPFALGVLGLAIEPLLLRRLRGRHLDQVLLTIGVSLVIADLVGLTFGREIRSIPLPPGLDRSVALAGGDYPLYRLFVIAFGIGLAVLLTLLPLDRGRGRRRGADHIPDVDGRLGILALRDDDPARHARARDPRALARRTRRRRGYALSRPRRLLRGGRLRGGDRRAAHRER